MTLEVHSAYNKELLEKLAGMFDGNPLQGNMSLYVREHFSLKRHCDNCGRLTNHRITVPSVIVEGPDWVLPISVRNDGQILIDVEKSIPDQSNFLAPRVTESLAGLGIVCDPQGRVDEVVPIAPTREQYYATLRQNKRWDYKNVRKHFQCAVLTDASPDDVLKWDTEVEYDYESHWVPTPGDRSCGFNVEAEYFQWLAESGQLVVGRISNERDETIALGYCVPEKYELVFVTLKRRHALQYRKYGLGNALFFMFFDYIYDNGLLTPLNLRSALFRHNAVWHPIPVFKLRIGFANSDVRQSFVDRFAPSRGRSSGNE